VCGCEHSQFWCLHACFGCQALGGKTLAGALEHDGVQDSKFDASSLAIYRSVLKELN